MSSVFVSYRRDDAAGYARELRTALDAHLWRGSVFMDLQIAPGDNFVERIENALGVSDALLVAIGPRWINTTRD